MSRRSFTNIRAEQREEDARYLEAKALGTLAMVADGRIDADEAERHARRLRAIADDIRTGLGGGE